jgi:predicted lipoprotein with Yx(FWY)xxD motif
MHIPLKQIVLAAAALITLAAHAQPVARNNILADAAGRTLYTFDKDTAGKSNCTGGCLTAWPAYVAKEGATAKGEFTLIEANGAKQWAFKGMPLYYFAGDTQAGDRNGDGSGGVWHVVTSTPAKTYSGY